MRGEIHAVYCIQGNIRLCLIFAPFALFCRQILMSQIVSQKNTAMFGRIFNMG